ncbi:MAG: EF-hand domain-containing protein [Streptococcus sp.]|nr:EF-hand domain-containing protein [Streptococcus sp.]
MTIEEAYKAFDRDFDGKINKGDLKWVLINILKVDEETIMPTKLERLFKLLDFYKSGFIQLSDIHRIVDS